jgi:hypothetical protein
MYEGAHLEHEHHRHDRVVQEVDDVVERSPVDPGQPLGHAGAPRERAVDRIDRERREHVDRRAREPAPADLPEREDREHGAARREQMHRPRHREAGRVVCRRALARHLALSSTAAASAP